MLTSLQSRVLRIIGVGVAVSLFLLLLVLVGLLNDTGRVSAEAEYRARAELDRYIESNPDKSARTLAVVDYSRPSWMKRMVIIDLQSGKRSFYRVAHGKNSGERFARRFSNIPESNMSSLGLFRVTRVYSGDHGRSLRLEGLDSLRNGNAAMRDIVLHSAGYVSIRYILLNLLTGYGPMIGRSSGCFAVSKDNIDVMVNRLAEGGFIYAWDGKEMSR